jgi:hypothetical protein
MMADGSSRHGGRYRPAMFRKQVSRPVDSLDPPSWPPRRNRSSELEERPGHGSNPRFLCPTGMPEGESPSGGSLLLLTNPAMSKPPGVNPIPEAELASPSCGHRCATSFTPQLGYVVPTPQETSAHAPNFAGKRPLTPTAVRAYRQSAKCRQLIGRHCALIVAALVPGPPASIQSLTARLTSREGSCADCPFVTNRHP